MFGLPAVPPGYDSKVTNIGDPEDNKAAIVDQSDDVRDPADDSGEIDDPTAMTDTYPKAFDDRIGQAQAAIAAHDPRQDRRSGGGNG